MATSAVWTPEEEFLKFAQTANLTSREDLMAIKEIWDNAFTSQVDKIASLTRFRDNLDDSLITNPFGTQRELGKPQ